LTAVHSMNMTILFDNYWIDHLLLV